MSILKTCAKSNMKERRVKILFRLNFMMQIESLWERR